MDFTHDHERTARIGMPETVFCENKSPEQIAEVIGALGGSKALFTRLAESKLAALPVALQSLLDYRVDSRTAFLNGTRPKLPRAAERRVGVVTAGTSDMGVAREATRTLEFLGAEFDLIADVGVAGLWRLQAQLERINKNKIVIVVAGMDAALGSVLGGLTGRPLIAVPASTGYGAARGGETALFSLLTSCAQGVTVVNIDNGFGAACAAFRILRLLDD